MGKKRSKTAKQKQARASKQFGVSVKKGGGREQVVPLVLEASKASKRRQHLLLCKSPSSVHVSKGRRPHFVKTTLPFHQSEQADFNQQMKSMEERQLSLHNKKTRKKPSTWSMSPATLIVNDKDKSTLQLVEEATSKVQALQDIGRSSQQQQVQNSNKLQILAAQHRAAAWSIEEKAVAKQSQNAFAALQQNDSDDNDDHGWGNDTEVKSTVKKTLLQFAPASFGVPTTARREEDDDPDL